jgi:hypothetical protein
VRATLHAALLAAAAVAHLALQRRGFTPAGVVAEAGWTGAGHAPSALPVAAVSAAFLLGAATLLDQRARRAELARRQAAGLAVSAGFTLVVGLVAWTVACSLGAFALASALPHEGDGEGWGLAALFDGMGLGWFAAVATTPLGAAASLGHRLDSDPARRGQAWALSGSLAWILASGLASSPGDGAWGHLLVSGTLVVLLSAAGVLGPPALAGDAPADASQA